MRSLWKIIAAMIFVPLVVLFGLYRLEAGTKTRVRTIEFPSTISVSGRLASLQPQKQTYKDSDIFISDEIESDFEFTSVGGSWEEIKPKGTTIDAEVRLKVKDQWSEWIEMEEEEDPLAENHTYAMASTDPAQAMQYKFLFYGNGTESPAVKNPQWTFLKAEKQITLKSPPKPLYASALPDPSGVITRAGWGADESLRYLKDNNTTPVLVELDPDFYDKYADELGYSRVVEADEYGNKYKWPLQYPEEVKKVVIHHTATTKNLDNPEQAIRDIYYYHAVTRGWGDIGYNYIVDLDGKIYEGRYGGEGVIGAHSGPGNHGSIGIAVLGNYQGEPVSDAVTKSLSSFIYKKAKIHGFKPELSSLFRGELMPNIFGHRDIMSTACPGEYLYNQIPVIRNLAAQTPDVQEKFVKDYAFHDLSELFYLELKPEEEREVTIKVENIGKITWDSKTFLVVDQNPEFDNVISFPTQNGEILAPMQPASVAPGEIATFKFKIKAHTTGKTVFLNMTPVINGTKKLFKYIIVPLKVQQPIYDYELYDADFPPALLKKDMPFDVTVKLKNVGNISWKKITLKNATASIVGNLTEEIVLPGQIGTFKFSYTGKKIGLVSESFVPYITNAVFNAGEEISFTTIIYEKDYAGEIFSKSIVKEWEMGKPYNLNVKLRNLGGQAWQKADLKVIFVKDSALQITDLSLSPETVLPGEIATVSFTVKANPWAKQGNRVVMFIQPKVKGELLLKIPVQYFYQASFTLGPMADATTESPAIRVKLGFSGEPEITANGNFEIYAGSELIDTLNAGELAKVSWTGSEYRLDLRGKNFLKKDYVRFVPKDGAILRIENFDRHPGWDQTLNDNEFRGVLEVRAVDSQLVAINELPLEDYLKGLAESLDSELQEKIKALAIAARSYAYFYMTIDEKFPGKPYHLDDDPAVSQKYLGYGYEKRAPNAVSGIDTTRGKVLTYGGTVVKAPYFHQSDGTRTKSAEEVWGWTHTPYLVSVDDSFCEADVFAGHGVGLSGCGARGMAASGKTYEEILKHYYTGIEITDLW